MLDNARHRAKKLIPFTIGRDDIVIPEFCPILGLRLYYGTWTDNHCSPSLDRIEPRLGYVPGNVRVISNRANILKRDATARELLAVANDVAKIEERIRQRTQLLLLPARRSDGPWPG